MWFPDRILLSVPEAFFLRALLRAEPWFPADLTSQYRYGKYTLDFAIPSLAVDIEIDGWRHNLPRERMRDKERTTYLESCGWRLFRFTDRDVCDSVTLPLKDPKYYPGWKADQCTWAVLRVLGRSAPEVQDLQAPVAIPAILMANQPFTRKRNVPPFHAEHWAPWW